MINVEIDCRIDQLFLISICSIVRNCIVVFSNTTSSRKSRVYFEVDEIIAG